MKSEEFLGNGIRLSDLRARIVEVGECWQWTGYAAEGRFPQWVIGGKIRPARRIVWQSVHGEIRKGIQIGVRCGCTLCVHPDHLVARTKSKAMSGRKITAAHRASVIAGKRAASKLSIETARAIRASEASNKELGALYGVSHGYVSKIRGGRAWPDMASPFAGLGART